MRTSCNGCRVLRKGCNDNCEIRPCIEWIKSAESQANATLFLAKFYGRAGLLNLINAGSQHERPGIFKSLLYEACGRIVNPTYGSVGLLSSGNWTQCQAAVDAVLAGSPIVESNAAAQAQPNYPNPIPPFSSSDIRHVHVSRDVTSLSKTRNRFKRSMNLQKIQLGLMNEPAAGPSSSARVESDPSFMRAVEAPWGNMGRGKLPDPAGSDDGEVGLELTLGFGLARN